MGYDPKHLREPKKAPASLLKKTLVTVGMLCLMVAVAVVGVLVTDLAEKKSVNYRTDSSTEIHKVLGDVYVHTGDGQRTTRIPLGTMMYIHNKYIKTDTCHGFTSNVFWGIDNKVVVHYSMFTNWFAAGEYEADEMFEISKDIPPGRYNVIKKTVSICNGKEHYTTNYKIEVEFFNDAKTGPKTSR
ncbi:MAG: hypothetical protein EOP83_03620 [Verrucomicrobiaceae bacterium]|nr:MAG: hypothetical protein EOP83_03620 [Verrucomicrobiaceae bacterium]